MRWAKLNPRINPTNELWSQRGPINFSSPAHRVSLSVFHTFSVGSTWWGIICALFWPRNMVIAMRLYWNQNATKGILSHQKKMSQTNNLWIKPLTCIPATIEPHPKVKWSKALFFHTTAIKRQLKKTITFRSRGTAGFLLRLLNSPCKCWDGLVLQPFLE